MIPYFEIHSFQIGPVVIQVWGLLVSLGFGLAVWGAYYCAKKYFLVPQMIIDIAFWTLLSGFVFARLFYVLFYALDFYYQNPSDVLKFWQGGASSLGGFFGAGVAVYIFSKVRKLAWKDLALYLDILALWLWLGWGIGRLGCFLIHDHIGRLSNFFLAINFTGGTRFDLGLLESILAFILFIIFGLLFKKITQLCAGYVLLYSFAAYAFIRFWLDFLRANDMMGSDIRYWQLTPAQWGMMLVFVGLTFFVIRSKIVKHT